MIESVMIAGIGGASLGTEIAKSLHMAGSYSIHGCDISPTAFGLYSHDFNTTRRVDRQDYVANVIAACEAVGARWLIPGGEQPMVLLGQAVDRLAKAGIGWVSNTPDVIALCSDKRATFDRLAALGLPGPCTAVADAPGALDAVGLPCIVKPATGTGGSASVFLAETAEEVDVYARFIRIQGRLPLAQTYLHDGEGEFTIGVLSLPDGSIAGSIALRRTLDAKLSVSYRGAGGVISSGYSQGHIGIYADLCQQAESIAKAIGSRGPLNIQGRVRDGTLVPFEINPRFSASTYLRAMAGFNEVDLLLRHLKTGERPAAPAIRTGWYLRSLSEIYVPEERVS